MKKDYAKSIIYKLVYILDTENKFCYIGTTTNWTVRKYQHKRRSNDINDKGYNNKVYQYIRKFGGISNWRMEVIEHYPCDNEKELSKRERYYIELYNSKLNTQYPRE